MGRTGPLPQPTNVRLLRGNPSKAPPRSTLKARPGVPNPPGFLDREALAEWRRVTPELERMGVLSAIDRAVLSTYCDTWSQWVKAAADLRENGIKVKARNRNDDRAGDIKNPAAQLYRNLAAQLHTLASSLGLTPAARLRLDAPKKDEEGDREDLLR